MTVNSSNYQLFFRFIEKFGPGGFTGIDSNDPLIVELENMMEQDDQFFYIADLIEIKILYTSRRSKEIMGVEPEDLTFYHFFEGMS